MRGERRAAARAVGNDLVTLVEQPLLVDLLERPPDRFDIIVVIGDVGMLHVHPVADAVAHLFPLALVLPDGLLALLDEGLDAVFFDVLLTVHAEGLLHFELDGQPVRVPARLAQDVFALHRLIAREDLLHDARQDMSDMGLAVRRGRTVEEGELLSALVLFDGLFKDVVGLPEVDDLLLTSHKIEGRIYFFVHKRLLDELYNDFFKQKNLRVSEYAKAFLPPKHTDICRRG